MIAYIIVESLLWVMLILGTLGALARETPRAPSAPASRRLLVFVLVWQIGMLAWGLTLILRYFF